MTTQIPTSYRYHPEGEDIQVLCKLFEDKLPNSSFGFNLDKSGKLRIKCWSNTKDRYYEQLIHNHHDPEMVSELFRNRCGTRLISLS